MRSSEIDLSIMTLDWLLPCQPKTPNRHRERVGFNSRPVPVDEVPRLLEPAKRTVDQLAKGLRPFRTRKRRRDQLAEGRASLRLVKDQCRQLLCAEFLEAVDGESGFARHAAYPVNA